MKKTFIAFLLMGSSCSLFAQETTDSTRRTADTTASTTTDMNSTMNNSTNMNSTNNMNTQADASTRSSNNNYNAYGSSAVSVPATAQYSFQKDYPTANDATWERAYNGHWRVLYRHNNDNMMMYYSDRGDSYMIALPVMQGMIPPEIMDKAKTTYGNNLYDVTALRGYDSQQVYQARILENGVARTEKFTADGSAVLEAPANTDAMNTDMMNNNTNQNQSGNGTHTMQQNGTGTMNNNTNNNMQGAGTTNHAHTGTTTDMHTGTSGTTTHGDAKTKSTKTPKSKKQ